MTAPQVDANADEAVGTKKLTYGIDDVPPWYLCFFMGEAIFSSNPSTFLNNFILFTAIQHYLTMIGAIVAIPFILTPALCMEDSNPARGTIISTMIFVTGLVTIFQATFGCRLPLVQGGTISFLVPTLAILNLEKWKCPGASVIAEMSADEKEELWLIRMRYLSFILKF